MRIRIMWDADVRREQRLERRLTTLDSYWDTMSAELRRTLATEQPEMYFALAKIVRSREAAKATDRERLKGLL